MEKILWPVSMPSPPTVCDVLVSSVIKNTRRLIYYSYIGVSIVDLLVNSNQSLPLSPWKPQDTKAASTLPDFVPSHRERLMSGGYLVNIIAFTCYQFGTMLYP